jgi:hypothetical protein
MLNLTVATRLLSFNYNCCADHIVSRRYIELQKFMKLKSHKSGRGSQILFEFFEGLLCFLGPFEFILLLEELEERDPNDAGSGDESA